MEIKYCEIREDAKETYDELVMTFGYDVENAFYAFREIYIIHPWHDAVEEFALYLAFCTELLSRKEDIGFLTKRLNEFYINPCACMDLSETEKDSMLVDIKKLKFAFNKI